MRERPLICGFLKVRDEIIRAGNLYRSFDQLNRLCDVIVACDDASLDGTREFLQARIPPERLLLVPHDEHDFAKELVWKQRMLDIVHQIKPKWIWWHDGDEELEDAAVAGIRQLCQQHENTDIQVFRAHYVQLWRNRTWYRVDDGFGDGYFLKLWRWQPNLSFAVENRTHLDQFPQQLHSYIANRMLELPWKVIHWGNYGVNLRWKAIQYYGGLGGVERHLSFEGATFRKVDLAWSPKLRNDEPEPRPFSESEKTLIRRMRNLSKLDGTFTVVIPTHNRAAYLPQTLQSLLDQTYDRWVALVLDDGSTDNTPQVMEEWQERDPRIFYARYPKMGAVAMNEIGMDLACRWSEWWTRLGSDDYFKSTKLERDAAALAIHDWVYGPYRVLRQDAQKAWCEEELCNTPRTAEDSQRTLLGGGFVVSWANVAARTSLLERVKRRFGRYCDDRLQNMEDFLVNARLARFAQPVFRGVIKGEFVVDPDVARVAGLPIEHEAIWRVNPIGASANQTLTGNEDELTRAIITEDAAR